GIRKNLRFQLRIGGRARRSPDWSGRHAAFAANLEFVFEQSTERISIHEQHHEVSRRCADLQAEAAASKTEESRRTPDASHTSTDHAVTAAAAHDKSRLDHAGKHRDRFRLVEQALRDSL